MSTLERQERRRRAGLASPLKSRVPSWMGLAQQAPGAPHHHGGPPHLLAGGGSSAGDLRMSGSRVSLAASDG